MATCILFQHRDFGGNSKSFTGSIKDLAKYSSGHVPGENWTDETSSVRIVSGQWQFFDHVNFDGARSPVLGPGDYPTVDHLGLKNDVISSLLCISE